MGTRPNVTPRADAARNIERILAAGREVFRERASAPFYTVAHAADVGQATLYRHFPNKQTLVHAIVEENLEALETATAAILEGGGRFDDVLGALAGQIAEYAELAVLLAAEADDDWYHDMISRVIDVLERAMRHDQAIAAVRADLDRPDLHLLLEMLGAAIAGDGPSGRAERGRRATALLLDGLRTGR